MVQAIKTYNSFLYRVYKGVEEISKASHWKGRLLALPLGFLLLITLPLARLFQLGEGIVRTVLSLFRVCQGYPISDLLKLCVGVIISPFSALIAFFAITSAMIADPVKSSQRFREACELSGGG